MNGAGTVSYALVAENLGRLPIILRRCFQDPWVADYRIRFGAPLVGSSRTLTKRLKQASHPLDELQAYLETCLLDEQECQRLATLQKKAVVERQGPVEAEALDVASTQAVNLSLRLHLPDNAPPEVRESMAAKGIFSIDSSTPQALLTARFLLRLNDPRNERLMFLDEIDAVAPDPYDAMALELRATAGVEMLWSAWLLKIEHEAGLFQMVELGAPTSHAIVQKDGHHS